jgi:hypothetical protein
MGIELSLQCFRPQAKIKIKIIIIFHINQAYRVSPSKTSLEAAEVGDLNAFLSRVRARPTSSWEAELFMTKGPIGSPKRSLPLNKFPKLKMEKNN